MAKNLWELRDERAKCEKEAMDLIFKSATMAAEIDLAPGNGRLLEVLTPAQQNKLLADKQVEVIREQRLKAKELYTDCHLAYVEHVKERELELHDDLFGLTKEMDAATLISLAQTEEEDLLNIAQMAATNGNVQLSQATLLAAHERGLESIHRLIDFFDEDEENIADLFTELWEIEQEDLVLDVQELELKFNRIAGDEPGPNDLLPGAPKRSVFVRPS
jgi:hypothetical protein